MDRGPHYFHVWCPVIIVRSLLASQVERNVPSLCVCALYHLRAKCCLRRPRGCTGAKLPLHIAGRVVRSQRPTCLAEEYIPSGLERSLRTSSGAAREVFTFPDPQKSSKAEPWTYPEQCVQISSTSYGATSSASVLNLKRFVRGG